MEWAVLRQWASKSVMSRTKATTPYEIAPQLERIRDEVLYADVWEQPELSKRDRSLVTCAALAALCRTPELEAHMAIAIRNGVTQDELRGLITHIAFYAGWPAAMNAGRAALAVFDDERD
ncbi:carboxymuconolactone decarboxylase family protein [Novosphingobium sp. 11B]